MKQLKILLIFLVIWICAFAALVFLPFGLKDNRDTLFVIQNGQTISRVAKNLAAANIIESPFLFTVLVIFKFDGKVNAGTYVIEPYKSLFERVRQVSSANGDRTHQITVTIPEGSNTREIADVFISHFPDFDSDGFVEWSVGKEGYLYPDTYKFSSGAAPHPLIVLSLLEKTSDEKLQQYRDFFEQNSDKDTLETFDDVINLAAIVELEATSHFDRRRIAGVLLNRLEQGIPLQVDVSFRAINGKNSYTLSRSDLKEDHPLNTYTRKGLPAYPIGNPSINSIDAVLNPIESDDLYFLADREGNTYFSETFEEHVEKKREHIYGEE